MRHQISGHHFNRDTNQRKALLRGLVRALVEHGEMVTTSPRAKELKRLADKLIHTAQTDTLNTRRELHRFFGRRDVVNTLVDRVAPAMKDRTSGFTTISPVAKRRGDNSAMVKISLMTMPDRVGTLKSGVVHEAPKTAKKTVKAKAETVKKEATKVETKSETKAEKPKAASKKKTAVVKKPAKK